ncbi:BREX-1 system adenine-specific DNA-methyltransferase PglX [Yeosuana sp.]|uniref:BREX-1 system adenine-specific DNA-methyltransferase PglX n=1 Tax=Yeosuana sp. TaxID=2529388 RepID=UPI00404A90D7
MNTNNIKSFAKQARLILIEGVKQRLLYWGFDENGNTTAEVNPTVGGYEFKGDIFTDESIPPKWNKLKTKLTNKQAVQDTIEEAAYTWFNRIMAIKILEKRGYIPATLAYVPNLKTPQIVQEAKRGQHQLKQQKYINLLQEYLLEDKEEQALGLLLTRLCNNNTVIHDVFGRIDDYTEILLPTNLLARNGIIDLLNSDALEEDQYQEVELIGWLYQFYISDKKDEVFKGFKANKKARPEDIPAATQIFTPKWIVKYMVENTVGKIYLDYDKTSSLKPEMKYLVENDTVIPSGVEGQAKSKSLIANLEELTLIDPASGSGHILVTGFELLFKMYREQGYTAKNAVISILQNNIYGLDIDDRAAQLAKFAILLKAAGYYPEILQTPPSGVGGLHIYSFPENTIDDLFVVEAISVRRVNDYIGYEIAENVTKKWNEDFEDEDTGEKVIIEKIEILIEIGKKIDDKTSKILSENNEVTSVLIATFKPISEFLGTTNFKMVRELAYALSLLREGKNIGAALKLELATEAHTFISNQYQNWNTQYQAGTLDILQLDLWNNLKPFLEVLLVMTKKYTAVVANPPYMGQKSMNAELKNYVNANYPISKSDLFAVFMEVCLSLNVPKGLMGMINQHSWMFLSSYEKLREHIIGNYGIRNMLHLGPRTFEELSGEVVQSTAFVLENRKGIKDGIYFRLVDYNNNNDKETNFLNRKNQFQNIAQENFEKIPGSPISYWATVKNISQLEHSKKIGDYEDCKKGADTGNNDKFLKFWHEVDKLKVGIGNKWIFYNKGGSYRRWYGNYEYTINWDNDGKELRNSSANLRSKHLYFQDSLTWNALSSGNFCVRFSDKKTIFDSAGSSLFINKGKASSFYYLGLMNTKVIQKYLLILNPTFNYGAGTVSKLPVIIKESDEIENIVKLNINLTKKDWVSNELSNDFEQSPLLNESTSLKEAYKKWQDEVNNDFFQLHENEEELNRIFIDIYGLQEELTPEVALKDISILQAELATRNQKKKKGEEQEQVNQTWVKIEETYRSKGKEHVQLPFLKDKIIGQFLSYSIGVFMGRYRLDKPGLHIAHPNPTEEELKDYTIPTQRENSLTIQNSQFTIDDDAIIPLMGSECAFPDDALVRIKNLIHTVWSEKSQIENSNFINECLGMDLDKWLTEKFWGYHTSMYKKKPIYWLFCSNPKKPQAAAFKVLVYMHRMDKYTVSKIQRNYLHPHQEWIKLEIEKLLRDEANLSKTELKRLEKLRTWEIECRDYNQVLQVLANQQIDFDLDDGVTVNYEKFETAVAKI